MKRILIFSTAYLPLIGGAEVAIKEITERVGSFDGLKTSFEFDLVTARIQRGLPKQEKVGNVNVYRVGWGSVLDKFLLPLLGLPLTLKLHKKNKYALAWAMMASQASVLAVFFKKLTGVKLLTTLQEGDEETHLARYAFGLGFIFKLLIRPWHRLAIKKADHIQVISSYLKERAQKAGATAPITVIPNGVNLTQFSGNASESEQQSLRDSLGIDHSNKVILSVSRLVHKNAMDTLVHAMQTVSNATCVIIGDGPEEKNLRSKIEDLGLKHSVILAGAVENQDLNTYYAIADVFVRPSRSEGQGIAFIEAMAAGVPVVAPAVGGIVDFLKDNETGLFCAVDDSEDIAEKLLTVLSNEELATTVKENALALVQREYAWDTLAPKMNKLFNTI